MRSSIALAVAISAALLVTPRDTEACSCKEPNSPCEDLAKSTVFIGRVVDEERLPRYVFYALEVSRVISGTLGATARLKTLDGCGATLRAGAEYLVYAHESSGELWVSACGRTKLLSEAGADLALAPTKRTTARVRGRAVTRPAGDASKPRPISGVALTIGAAKVKTRKDGTFVTDLPVGMHPIVVGGGSLRVHRDRPPSLSVPHAEACPVIDIELERATELAALTISVRTPKGGRVPASLTISHPGQPGTRNLGTDAAGTATIQLDRGREVIVRACGQVSGKAACAVTRRTMDGPASVDLVIEPPLP